MSEKLKKYNRRSYFAMGSVGLILVVGILCYLVFVKSPQLGTVVSIISSGGLIITAIIALRSLSIQKEIAHGSIEIARATFIVKLNKTWVENSEYSELYGSFQRCIEHQEIEPHKSENCKDCNNGLERVKVSNYLTFFETIYILYKRGVIDFEILDDLFAYRFFTAVHNSHFVREKLKQQPYNFINIFCLEYEWLKYRKKIGKGDEDKKNIVMKTGLLEDLIVSAIYKDILKKGGVL